MRRAQAAQILFQNSFIQLNVIQEFHWGKRENSKEVCWVNCCSNLICFQLFELRELTDSYELLLSWRLVSDLLHLVPSRETKASLGVLRSHCLSAIQELVGRNGLPLLLLSTAKSGSVIHFFMFFFSEY